MVVLITAAFTPETIVPSMDGMGGRTPILNQIFYERHNEY
jgi:hypothetical protein